MDNTRPVRRYNADRAPNKRMTQRYVRTLVCTVCFQWNVHTNRVRSSESYLVSAVFYWIGTYCNRENCKKYKKNYFWWSIVVLESFDCTWWDLSKNIIAHYFVVSMLTTFYRLSHIMQNSIVFVLIYLHMYRYTYIHVQYLVYLYTWQKSTSMCRNN